MIDWNDSHLQGPVRSRASTAARCLTTWYKMIAMVQGGLDLTPVITHRFHYTEFEKGFEAMNIGQFGQGHPGLDQEIKEETTP